METPPTLPPPYTLEDARKEIDKLRSDIIYYAEKVEKLNKALSRFAGIIKSIEKEEKV